MATDHHWMAVCEAVQKALLEDVKLHEHPPASAEEVEHVAETVADHLVSEFVFTRRNDF